jgi:hypothetical protein
VSAQDRDTGMTPDDLLDTIADLQTDVSVLERRLAASEAARAQAEARGRADAQWMDDAMKAIDGLTVTVPDFTGHPVVDVVRSLKARAEQAEKERDEAQRRADAAIGERLRLDFGRIYAEEAETMDEHERALARRFVDSIAETARITAERLRALSAPPAPALASPGETAAGPTTWGVSADGESFHGHFTTKEEALAAAPTDLRLEPGQRFWVGGGARWRPHQRFPADRIIKFLGKCAGDECGEIAEDWPAPSREDKSALEHEVHAVVMAWLRRTGNLPDFYCCEVTEAHVYQPPAPRSSGTPGTATTGTAPATTEDRDA